MLFPTKFRCLFLWCCFCPLLSFAQDAPTSPYTYDEVRAIIQAEIEETQSIYHWKDADDHLLWSAVLATDSLVSIGYCPPSVKNWRTNMHNIDFDAGLWKTTREDLIDFIVNWIAQKHGARYKRGYLMPFGEKHPLPYINIRVFDKELIQLLRNRPDVRYLDVMTFKLEEENTYRDGGGCDLYDDTISSADTAGISPQASQSWHHAPHNITQAWQNSNKGTGIGIAVIDTGASDQQDKLTSEFAEGESTGRTVTHRGFFNGNDWQDDCGHGTAMAGLAAAPRGFDHTPAGVAYKANLYTYRGTDDVVINEAAEKDGVSACLTDAADDPNIHIISMSLGDVFSNGQVADAVIYANSAGKLIFAAAGTSTSFTNWYGVIFPAWMPETVAVTGVTDGSPRTTCDICHDGSEVDFVVAMERQSNGNHAITIGMPNLSLGYVGGSSAATATTAGIAALVWGNNPAWNKGQVLNRLIQSADYYPNRDSDFGWGKIDADLAVAPSPYSSCTSRTGNDFLIEITNISFPAFDEGFGDDNEWVIKFDGAAHYFRVDENGASGSPAGFMDVSVCGSLPMIFNLGQTNCGESTRTISIETHENDSASDNCDYSDNGFFGNSDDALATQTLVVDFTQNTITHNNPEAGNFVFTYTPLCTPLSVPLTATINGPASLCQGEPVQDITLLGAGGTPPYDITYTLNGGAPQVVSTSGNTATIPQGTTTQGTFTYEIISISDATSCDISVNETFTTTVYPAFAASIALDALVCESEPLTLTASPAGQTEYLFYQDSNLNGTYDVGEELQGGASNTYASSTLPKNTVVYVLITNTDGCRASDNVTITYLPDYDPSCDVCPPLYNLSGTDSGASTYETDGAITSTQIIDNTAVVEYDSGTEVSLQPGFEVILGATFQAIIDGCDAPNVQDNNTPNQ